MKLRELLAVKGRGVYTISPTATLDEVARTLVQYNVGSLIAAWPDEPARPLGIITERDILRVVAAGERPLSAIAVNERMSTNLAVAHLDDSVEHAMGIMTQRRIRHLPILEDGRLEGMISIGDLVKSECEQLCFEVHYLKQMLVG